MSPRAPAQAARRDEIVAAAAEVLRTQGVAACTARSIALFVGLVAATGVDHPEDRAHALFAALVGTIVLASMHSIDVDRTLGELARSIGLPFTEP